MTPEEIQQVAAMRAAALRGEDPRIALRDANALSGIGGALAGLGGESVREMSRDMTGRGEGLRGDALRALARREQMEIEAQRAKTGRAEQLSDIASQRKWQSERDAINDANQLEVARIMANQKATEKQAKTEEDRRKVTVPGYDVAADAYPSEDDAKKMKASLAAAGRMKNYVTELRELHRLKGTEMGGAAGTRMGQLATAIKLEGKNIAELGALSGPDLGLMEQLAGTDPTSLGANLKALAGIDHTGTALDGLEKWTGDTLSGNAGAMGYKKKESEAPAAAPAPAADGAPPPGMKWQVNKKTRERRLVPIGG